MDIWSYPSRGCPALLGGVVGQCTILRSRDLGGDILAISGQMAHSLGSSYGGCCPYM